MATYLTRAEQELIERLGSCYGAAKDISTGGPCHADDLAEIRSRIHDLQGRVTGMAAARIGAVRPTIGGFPMPMEEAGGCSGRWHVGPFEIQEHPFEEGAQVEVCVHCGGSL